MAAYCEEVDLLTGNIPTHEWMDIPQYIQAAADEINAALAMRYVVPVVVSGVPQYAATPLFLKGINAKLASGRIITAAATSAEQTEVHAYGLYLIKEALEQLKTITCGDYVLPGAPQTQQPGTDTSPVLISNVDPESQVEAFYSRVSGYPPLPVPPWAAWGGRPV